MSSRSDFKDSGEHVLSCSFRNIVVIRNERFFVLLKSIITANKESSNLYCYPKLFKASKNLSGYKVCKISD